MIFSIAGFGMQTNSSQGRRAAAQSALNEGRVCERMTCKQWAIFFSNHAFSSYLTKIPNLDYKPLKKSGLGKKLGIVILPENLCASGNGNFHQPLCF